MDTLLFSVVVFLTISLNLTSLELAGMISLSKEKNKKGYSLWKYWPISIWLIVWGALWEEMKRNGICLGTPVIPKTQKKNER